MHSYFYSTLGVTVSYEMSERKGSLSRSCSLYAPSPPTLHNTSSHQCQVPTSVIKGLMRVLTNEFHPHIVPPPTNKNWSKHPSITLSSEQLYEDRYEEATNTSDKLYLIQF